MDRKAKKHAYYLANKHRWNTHTHTDTYREQTRLRNKRIRIETLQAYGGKCECCGESRYEFMAIDHINGGGVQHRKQIGWNGNSLAKWLRKQGYPKGFRILCHNCNCAIGFYKACPHKTSIADMGV